MITSLRLFLFMIGTLFAWTCLPALHAQETAERLLYYLAADADGIQQVYKHRLPADEVRQITYADEDVTHFGVAYDSLSVAYLSESQLWLQPLHTEAAEALVNIVATEDLAHPVYSQDGQYIAYTNNGVWLLDLGTRETRQILVNRPLDLPRSHVSELRLYTPRQFVVDEEGKAAQLLVNIHIWEWNTFGVYDLATDTLQEFETEGDVRLHTDLLVLSNGRVLLYGNNMMAGEPALHIADSLDDINAYTRVFDYRSLAEEALFVEQAVELHPGIVRLFGTAITLDAERRPIRMQAFTFDYDVVKGSAGEIAFVGEMHDVMASISQGPLSADGVLVPILFNPGFDDKGVLSGEVRLLNLETGAMTEEVLTEAAGGFAWQPRQEAHDDVEPLVLCPDELDLLVAG
jgi:hypothetical protein